MTRNELLQDYNASRDPLTDDSVLCHAPFVNLNFEQNGNVTACCYNRSFVLGRYPEQSVDEIWKGTRARALRDAFLRNAEPKGCELCFHQLRSRNFGGNLMRNFDCYSDDPDYETVVLPPAPRLLEFEISNTCNLECVMCSGHFSSSIRANREKLPPLRSPYDRAFVDQLDPYLPTVVGAKFLGGEPFLIERYYQIWDRFRGLNPRAKLTITTNATIIPERARDLLEDLQVAFAVSLDGATPSTYEGIRRKARFEDVMVNVDYLLDYTRRHKTTLEFTVCPMTHNWRELPALLEFCQDRQASIHFNMVLRPQDASLGGLPAAELAEVIEYLERVRPLGDTVWAQKSRLQWEGLLAQLRGWYQEKLDFRRRCGVLETDVQAFADRHGASTTRSSSSDGIDPLLSSLVHSFSVARERATRARVDFVTLLPRPPLAVVADGGPPTTKEILLTAHLLRRFLDESLDDSVETCELDAEQQLLETYLMRHPEWLDRLGCWLQERIREAEIDVLLALVDDLLEGLKSPVDWRRHVRDGLAELKSNGLDDTGYQMVTVFFEGLIERFRRRQAEMLGLELDLWLPRSTRWEAQRRRRPSSWEQIGTQGVSTPPIRDPLTLHRALQALCLFHRCYQPFADHAAFRSRLEACMVMVAGFEDAACRSMGAADPFDVYQMFAYASDHEVRRNVESFMSALDRNRVKGSASRTVDLT